MVFLILVSSYSGFVEPSNIEDYTSHRDKYVTKAKGWSLKNAIDQIDEFIIDPMVNIYCCFAI